MSNTVEKQSNDDDDDDDLEDFFEEINKLTLGDTASTEDGETNNAPVCTGLKGTEATKTSTKPSKSRNTSSIPKETLARKELMDRAETSRQ